MGQSSGRGEANSTPQLRQSLEGALRCARAMMLRVLAGSAADDAEVGVSERTELQAIAQCSVDGDVEAPAGGEQHQPIGIHISEL